MSMLLSLTLLLTHLLTLLLTAPHTAVALPAPAPAPAPGGHTHLHRHHHHNTRASSGPGSRLQCLQKGFGSPHPRTGNGPEVRTGTGPGDRVRTGTGPGDEVRTGIGPGDGAGAEAEAGAGVRGQWVLGHADASDASSSNAQSPKQWVYQDPECSLMPFDVKSFCQNAVGCGKKLLIVGDSTVKSLSDFYEHFFQTRKATAISCPTPNNCLKGSPRNFPGVRGCVMGGHYEKIRVNHICTEYCSEENKTQLTYVRHDYLAGIHGQMHFKSAVCDHWTNLAQTSDIVMISSAAHIHELLNFPNETKAKPDINYTKYIDASAAVVANRLKTLKMKPNTVLVYMTASAGIENFTSDCSLKPEDVPLPYDTMFSWDKVPYMQATYVRAIRQAMMEINQPFLVLDMQHLMQMRRGCRGDFVHGNSQVKGSSYFTTWQVLYNLLVEYNSA